MLDRARHPVCDVCLFALALTSLVGCLPKPAVSSAPGVEGAGHERAIARGRAIVRPIASRGSAVAVAVGVNGELVWSEGFGRVARHRGATVQAHTPFRVYSLMKQVTAVLALQSASRRELDLRTSVRRTIPELPPHYEPVTLLQLLTHRSGVRHYRDSSEARLAAHCAIAAAALPMFVDDSLTGVPGEAESYSTWGFVLASAVLERAAGIPFDSLLATSILHPASMTATWLEEKDDPAGRLHYYEVDAGGSTSEAAPIDNSCKMGGGGFVMSAEDMVRFHGAVLRGELVPMSAVRQLLGSRTALYASGSGPGGEAVSRVDLQSRVSVVVLSNTSGLEQRLALERALALLAAVFADEP
jgi:CubicO group peptidase (beta-lactamase class C family)